MEFLAPIIGHRLLDDTPLLKYRILHLIEDLGCRALLVDSGSIFLIHEADPLKCFVPFVLTIKDSTSFETLQNWLAPVRIKFPSLIYVEGIPDYLPIFLTNKIIEQPTCKNLEYEGLFRETIRFIYGNLDNPSLNIGMICSHVCMTKYKLESIFEHADISGIWRNVIQIRMNEAKRLLQETKRPVNEIAIAVGYPDLSSFDKTFKRWFNASPKAVRQKDKSFS